MAAHELVGVMGGSGRPYGLAGRACRVPPPCPGGQCQIRVVIRPDSNYGDKNRIVAYIPEGQPYEGLADACLAKYLDEEAERVKAALAAWVEVMRG